MMDDLINQRFGNYRLIRLLGTGGYAKVYLGEHIHMGTQAAVKVLTSTLEQDAIDLFRTEGIIAYELKHPHIVRVHDYGLYDGNTPYIVMDYAVQGFVLRRHPRGTRVPLQTVVEYVKQVAAALQYAHDRGFVHRDVKPENLLIGRHDEILLSDFGIVTFSVTFNPNLSRDRAVTFIQVLRLLRGLATFNLNQPRDPAGTWPYIAPEQIWGMPVRASDQYALGITVYEWLCGEPP
jgi:serine/threonine protein kinase